MYMTRAQNGINVLYILASMRAVTTVDPAASVTADPRQPEPTHTLLG